MPVHGADESLQSIGQDREHEKWDRQPDAVEEHERQPTEVAVLRHRQDGRELGTETRCPPSGKCQPQEERPRRSVRGGDVQPPITRQKPKAQHSQCLQREHDDQAAGDDIDQLQVADENGDVENLKDVVDSDEDEAETGHECDAIRNHGYAHTIRFERRPVRGRHRRLTGATAEICGIRWDQRKHARRQERHESRQKRERHRRRRGQGDHPPRLASSLRVALR